MEQAFNIDLSEIVKLTNKLEKLHRSALPIAIRSTLNDAAFDAKQIQVINTSKEQFTIRKKTFIKSHTTANKCKNTFDIRQMESSMGVIKGKSDSGDKLKIQELGGKISNRDAIPTNEARVGRNANKLVSKKYYLQNLKTKGKKLNKPRDIMKAAAAAGKGGIIRYGNTLAEIKQFRRDRGVKLKKIYALGNGRSVQIKKAPFISNAGHLSSKKINRFYRRNALRRIKKELTK